MHVVNVEYCRKGPLDKILENPDIDLTWIFRYSLINDLLKGVHFIHQSKIETHGLLTSACCVITGRWELKIANFGVQKIRQAQLDPTVLSFIDKQYPGVPSIVVPNQEILLWLAPESVGDLSSYLKVTFPSRKADIYR
jgi:serine/threonine protein kinase